MYIIDINFDKIIFDNGNYIIALHSKESNEINFANFNKLNSKAKSFDFDENLVFEIIDEYGFRFGNDLNIMFFVPCFSIGGTRDNGIVEVYYFSKNNELINGFPVDCKLLSNMPL